MQVTIATFGPSMPTQTTTVEIEQASDYISAVKVAVDRFIQKHPQALKNINLNIKVEERVATPAPAA